MKKYVSIFVVLLLFSCLCGTALAANDSDVQAAQDLYDLGLFRGTGTTSDGKPIFDLDKAPTRDQALIMLVRLLGMEKEALAGDWDIPFTDVSAAMRPYVGYAYNNGVTNGTSATTYSGSKLIQANQYITFVLRSLGYESGKDFQYATAWDFSDQIGLTDGSYNASSVGFNRGDVAQISNTALDIPLKGEDTLLLDQLVSIGAVDSHAADIRRENATHAIYAPRVGSILEKTDLSYPYGKELLTTASSEVFSIGTFSSSSSSASAKIDTDFIQKALGAGTYYVYIFSANGSDEADCINDWIYWYLANYMFGDSPANSATKYACDMTPGDDRFVCAIFDQSGIIRGYTIIMPNTSGDLIMTSCCYNISRLQLATQARIEELRSRRGNLSIRETGREEYNEYKDGDKQIKVYEGNWYDWENLPANASAYLDGRWPDTDWDRQVRPDLLLFRLWCGNLKPEGSTSGPFIPDFSQWQANGPATYVLVVTDQYGEPLDYLVRRA